MFTANCSEWRASDVVGRPAPGKLVANLIYDCFFIAVDRSRPQTRAYHIFGPNEGSGTARNGAPRRDRNNIQRGAASALCWATPICFSPVRYNPVVAIPRSVTCRQ
jgi:hypothetical protein